MVPGKSLSYVWEDHGLKLHIPADALEPINSSVTLTIQASIAGHYQLPDKMEFVSGAYCIAFPGKLSRPVTLELQHCACLESPEDLSHLTFVTAKCNPDSLPYKFETLSEGLFSTTSRYGVIELRNFSWVSIVWQRVCQGVEKLMRFFSRNSEGESCGEEAARKEIRLYTAQIYYTRVEARPTVWLMEFVIIWDLDIHLKVVFVNWTQSRLSTQYILT